MKFLQLILVISSLIDTHQVVIKNEFHLCHPTTQNIDLDLPCNDNNCVSYKNTIASLTKLNDVFNYIYSNNKKEVVYSLNGQVFIVTCEIVNEIDVYEKVTSCTDDIMVSTFSKKIKIDAYITKIGILRLQSKKVECASDNIIRHFNNENREFQIFIKNNLITIIQRNETSVPVEFENNLWLIEIYNKFSILNQSALQFTRDFSLISITFFILIQYFAKNSNFKRFKRLLKCSKYFKNYEKNKKPKILNSTFNPTLISNKTSSMYALPSHPIQLFQITNDNVHDSAAINKTAISNLGKTSRSCSSIHMSTLNETNGYNQVCPVENCRKMCKGLVGLKAHMRIHDKK